MTLSNQTSPPESPRKDKLAEQRREEFAGVDKSLMELCRFLHDFGMGKLRVQKVRESIELILDGALERQIEDELP